ncbi:MAG: THUMP domain-containing protein [Candidatus Nanohaloarchaea archaeon]|nr:THUMP domain-containing protein [Candidatus Nanohaloarchaea archaeon]
MKIIVSSSELSLKSPPVERKMTDRLTDRIREQLARRDIEAAVIQQEGRMFVKAEEDDVPDAVEALERTPGIKLIAPALETDLDIDSIWDAVQEAIQGEEPDSFAVDARRTGEEHDYTSKDLENEIGQRIVDEKGWDVDLDDPDLTVSIEARYENAYVYTRVFDGVGGVPISRDSVVVVPVRDRVDVYAGYLLMKRGCTVAPVYNGNHPPEADEAVTVLSAYDPGIKLVTMDRDSDVDAINAAAEQFDATAIGVGLTFDEIEDFDPEIYERSVLTPTCSLSEEEVLEQYAAIAVPRV